MIHRLYQLCLTCLLICASHAYALECPSADKLSINPELSNISCATQDDEGNCVGYSVISFVQVEDAMWGIMAGNFYCESCALVEAYHLLRKTHDGFETLDPTTQSHEPFCIYHFANDYGRNLVVIALPTVGTIQPKQFFNQHHALLKKLQHQNK